ncbi:hypothetical protein GOL30_28585 [Sinorhizobium medicae]|uniref:Uncharacterized protein n=1 Tax=Sinorhizobium medicae (strain WSM419) TaxID=366394 RepID=A6UAP5_SINMW|nr:hypothetical protein [Sinorhizobium medicae]ABR60725.1 conserved hypothetical protein [Sinorhizobium medicae WSM419]MBO1943952.1 hypothetical protein [Sinorhizobium medicae]MDX0432959.1 hypothetical protein [Sinorhizobium medicae]MDX0436784.1 hypothetical protein [Sinorhizobium medicae]MDX0454482.1 hypothetical protein [Sinorhizobium medicae]
MKITNTQPGPRGINTVNGPVLVEPGQTVEVEIFAREKAHIKASKWFEVEGDYTDNPGVTAAPALNDAAQNVDAELDRLRAQLAERDAELAKLKAQDDQPKTAAEVLAMANDPNVQFMSFKSAASKLLGDKTPAKKDEIVAALEDLATKPGA